ncbi:MAG: hypothetical protein COB67_00310 [SAR324 cluster bacterium]|uniref:Uncharacterized protein n=1 Tax=SAR324 cluster bacterium TaxID=2024889 RepID=A0A2A4TBM1_9DELT|nr:MAG: hypothetical protein COB67_00310 [SAR324 cluster bacterium]
MRKTFLLIFLLISLLNAGSYTLHTSTPYSKFLSSFKKYVDDNGRVLSRKNRTPDTEFASTMAYVLHFKNVKYAKKTYKLIPNTYLKTLPFELKMYAVDMQFYIGAYQDVLRTITLKECLTAPTFALRKECRYYLGISTGLTNNTIDKNLDYSKSYYQNAKQLVNKIKESRK